MKEVHREKSRWKFDFGWLKTAHSFSFWEYYNPQMMWFWTLRVINDDTISAWQGFPTHPHNNMEIITIPLEWSLSHKDSMGNWSIIESDEVQAMSAGSWVLHSEYNPQDLNSTQLFQIWIHTKYNNIQPQYNQKRFSEWWRKNKFQLLVSPEKKDDVVFINQNAYISRVDLEKWQSIEYKKHLADNWIYFLVISWDGIIDDELLKYRDAVWITQKDAIKIEASSQNFDVLILEVPMK